MIKVIIADDEAKVCTLIQNLLDWSEFGMEICGVAHNGNEALELIEKHNPDLIVTDIRMPGCDGLELIAKAREIRKDLEFVIISGYRQFEYAQSAIKYGVSNYLLKPLKSDEMRRTLAELEEKIELRRGRVSEEKKFRIQSRLDSNKLREAYMSGLLLGSSETAEGIDDINTRYHFNMRPGAFSALIAKLDKSNGITSDELSVLHGKMTAAFEPVREACFDFETYSRGSRLYGIMNFDADNAAELDRALKHTMNTLNIEKTAFDGLEFSICLGSRKSDISQIKQSVAEAEMALGQRLISFSGRIITYENIKKLSGYDSSVLSEFGREAALATELFDREKIVSAVDRFYSSLNNDADLSGKAYYDATVEAFGRFCFILKNAHPQEETDRMLLDFSYEADRCGDTKLLSLLLKEKTGEVLDRLKTKRENEDNKPVRIAKDFIINNYMNPITLEQVSGLVGFNASYFSSFFKKKTGQGFLDYLSDVRVKKAKELLRETDYSVAKICETVGYSDIRHFSRTFRKLTGITPAEYRKLYS